MAHLPSWDDPNRMKPGTYYVEVLRGEEKRSKNGDPYFRLYFGAVDWGKRPIFEEIVMLDGPGWNMGKAKLSALGIPKDTRELSVAALIGARAFAFLADADDRGETVLKPDIRQGSHCGFSNESEREDVGKLMLPDPDQEDGPLDDPFVEADDTPF